MEATTPRPTWKTLLAFAIIYFVWGSTFLAIRIGVREVPPFLLAAMRFLVAGLLLYGWMLARGERSPSARHWASASLLAILIFILDYGLLFWAEQRVASGVAAVMMAMNAPVHGSVGNHFPANAEAHRSPGPGALDWNRRSGGCAAATRVRPRGGSGTRGGRLPHWFVPV